MPAWGPPRKPRLCGRLSLARHSSGVTASPQRAEPCWGTAPLCLNQAGGSHAARLEGCRALAATPAPPSAPPTSARPSIKALSVRYACLSMHGSFDLFIMQSGINRRCPLLICCPPDDAAGDFTVRCYSNFYSTRLNRSGVRQIRAYTAYFPFSSLP